MKNLGDFATSSVVRFFINTHKSDGTPITLAGTPAVSVYKDASTTESTAGVTLTVDFDSRTGMHLVAIDTSADGTFYSSGSDFRAVITAGTVDSISVVGTEVGLFSLNGRSALRPTTAGRTLDVSTGGEAGIDWANIGSPTTTVSLSGTTVSVVSTLTGYTSPPTAVQIRQEMDSNSTMLAAIAGYIDTEVAAIKAKTELIVAAPANWGSLAITVGGAVTAGTVSDKTGYALASNGVDQIVVETGINLRQSLSPILAAAAGALSGAGTGTITIKGAGVAATRIEATTDNAGNRSAVTMTLPS